MTDETGGKPLPVSKQVPLEDLAELLSAADECAGVAETGVERKYWATLWGRDDPGYRRDLAPVRRLRAAVARVRGE